MPVVSVKVDEATVNRLDEIAKDMRMETGQNISRSDLLKVAIIEFIRNS